MRGFKTLYFKNDKLFVIDQRKLPLKITYFTCRNENNVCFCIENMVVRGAPAIGVAAGFGVYLGMKRLRRRFSLFKAKRIIRRLSLTRPTARNLFWVLERMERVILENKDSTLPRLKSLLLREAKAIYNEEKETSLRIGEYGKALLKDKDNVLTICNAGSLATVDYGTALSVVYRAKAEGKKIRVYACETRPLLQGARLTVWELLRSKVETILISDFTAGRLMQQGGVDKIVIGADRVCLNGDMANKIGSFTLAVLAKAHHIPFYVAAPLSTFDASMKTWKEIPIEERSPREVKFINERPIAPPNVKVYNPAFDCVPQGYISAFITDRGIIKPPFKNKIRALVKEKG